MAASLAGQIAVVTGGGSGIGRAAALALAGENARVVVADVRAEAAGLVSDEIRAKGGEALAVATDVSDAAAVEKLVATTLDTFGQIHVLFNSAGISLRRSVIEMTDAEWHRVLGVNLHGTFYAATAASSIWRRIARRSAWSTAPTTRPRRAA